MTKEQLILAYVQKNIEVHTIMDNLNCMISIEEQINWFKDSSIEHLQTELEYMDQLILKAKAQVKREQLRFVN